MHHASDRECIEALQTEVHRLLAGTPNRPKAK